MNGEAQRVWSVRRERRARGGGADAGGGDAVFRWALWLPALALGLAIWWAGYWPCVVLGRSMEPAYYPGDIIIVRRAPEDEVHPGDVIVWRDGRSPGTGPGTAHRVVAVRLRRGMPYFLTRGDANPVRDPRPVRPGQVQGKVVARLPLLGRAVAWMRTPAGLVATVAFPALALVQSYLAARREVSDNGFSRAPVQQVAPSPALVGHPLGVRRRAGERPTRRPRRRRELP